MEPEYIPLQQCRARQLYLVEARALRCEIFFDKPNRKFLGQFAVAVFDGTINFMGIRDKIVAFVDDEEHWDTGEPHGTVKPLRKIDEVLPADINLEAPGRKELFLWLQKQHDKYITVEFCCPEYKPAP